LHLLLPCIRETPAEGGGFFLGKEELVILNSWVQEFFYNLNDSIKAFFIL
uniref:Uncharacterized protein n=1 Tax=Aegilops tauschii subsp. strangulata TaxID=200361 RepID=A0A453MTX2_AEGTS